MKTSTKLIYAALPIAFAGLSANAQIFDYAVDDRIAVGFGSHESASGSFDFSSEQSQPDIFFQDWSGAADGGVAAGSGFGSMDSTIGADSFGASGAANASATFTNDLTYLSALGSSSHTVGFSLAETTTFSFVGELDVTGTANAWARVREGFNFGTVLYEARTFDGSLSFDDLITLGPGDYSVQLFANSNITLTAAGSAAGNASFQGTFAITPAPSSAIAPLAFLAIASRRRR